MNILMSVIIVNLMCTGSLFDGKPEHAGHGHEVKKEKKYKKHNKCFSTKDENTIKNYYRNLARGLQKKMRRDGKLPPGWDKKVSIGKPIPKEYLKIAKPVADDLRIRLHLDSKTKLLQISNKLLKVEIGTNRLLGELKF